MLYNIFFYVFSINLFEYFCGFKVLNKSIEKKLDIITEN
jgi:hypothetical protein